MPSRISLALAASLLLASSASLPACNKGPAEKAGERVDDTINDATKGHTEPLEKGPAQKAGKSVDDATGQ
jgi:hypothetical protein